VDLAVLELVPKVEKGCDAVPFVSVEAGGEDEVWLGAGPA
jgi:hypothetical protein